MHKLIGIIVHAEDEKEALTRANYALDELTKGERPFDGYSTLDDEQIRDMWDLSPVMLASSPEGKHFIEKGWEITVEGLTEALEHVKLAIQHLSPQEIMERRYPEDLPEDIRKKIDVPYIREYFDDLSDRPGYRKFLYQEYGGPILNNEDLEFALEPKEGLNVYVVPADVHC